MGKINSLTIPLFLNLNNEFQIILKNQELYL